MGTMWVGAMAVVVGVGWDGWGWCGICGLVGIRDGGEVGEGWCCLGWGSKEMYVAFHFS